MKTNKESNNKFTSRKKKQWHKPQIQRLDVQETLGGAWDAKTEGSFWFITWGPQPS
jgi:hypothetical protein